MESLSPRHRPGNERRLRSLEWISTMYCGEASSLQSQHGRAAAKSTRSLSSIAPIFASRRGHACYFTSERPRWKHDCRWSVRKMTRMMGQSEHAFISLNQSFRGLVIASFCECLRRRERLEVERFSIHTPVHVGVAGGRHRVLLTYATSRQQRDSKRF